MKASGRALPLDPWPRACPESEEAAPVRAASTSGSWAVVRLCGPEVGCGLLAATPVGLNLIGDLLTLCEAAHPRTLDGADVHEHILAALIGLDEAITLLFVEPLHSTSRHCMSFHGRGHERRAPERAQARLSIIWKG